MNREPEHLTREELAFAERWMESVDRAARGELDADELGALEKAARSNAMLREALDDARRLRPHFDRLKAAAPSGALDQRILGAIDELDAEPVSRPKPTHHPVRRSHAPRPGRAIPAWGWTAVAAAVVVLLVWAKPAPIEDRASEPAVVAREYSEAEVQAAAQDMEMAMAVLRQTMQRTSRQLQQEMTNGVRETLNESFRQGFGRTLDQIPYLNRSSTNEEHSGIPIPPRGEFHRSLGVALPGERT
jgi:hypothetical protein